MKVLIGPFSLHSVKDADIIAEFEEARNKSEHFRQRMRQANQVTMQSIADDVREIKRMLQDDGVIVQAKNDKPVNDQLVDLCDRALSGLGAE